MISVKVIHPNSDH